jgi:nucleoid DNA-binding protein/Sec-independent protein translocase protein TatA
VNISLYIKELILKNECVILPEFGGFETHYQPSSIDKVTGKLTPPSKQVVFREEFKKDNGTIVRVIQSKENLNEEDARAAVNNYVAELKAKLNSENRFEIEGIGVLIKRIDGALFFKPAETENFLIESFGLSELKLPTPVISEKKAEPLPVSEPEISRSGKSLYIVTLITVVITILIIASVKFGLPEKLSDISSRLFDEKKEEKTVFGKMKDPQDSSSKSSELEKQIEDNTSVKNALRYQEPEPEKKVETPPPVQITNHEDNRKYLIVAGSFVKESYAVKQADKLKNIGYTPTILRTKKGQYRVILNTYSDKNFAIQELERYRTYLGNNIWLWADC